MQEDPVYAKTARGVAEIAARSGALSLAARRILILIDGARPLSALRPFARAGEFDGILATLKAQGMIELVALAPPQAADADGGSAEPAGGLPADPAPAAAQPPPVAAQPAAARPPTVNVPLAASAPSAQAAARQAPAAAPRAFEEGKRVAVRELYARLGPYGEGPAAKIQECTTMEALREQIQNAVRRVATIRGPEEAKAYLEAIGFAAS